MSKVLRICKSEDLPALASRDSNYVYFVYDKMTIYVGRNYYSDPFCIVERVPDDPVEGMLYITMDGDMKTSIDSAIVDIGTIEDEEQKQYLTLAGTVYFMKAESRYLDLQTRTVHLPYQNGSYILTVSMAKDIMIDEDTVIRYDPSSGEFVLDGNPYIDDTSGLPGLNNYTAVDTPSVNTDVTNNQISANVKLSTRENNMLRIFGNGLYASTQAFASEEELNRLITAYANYKALIDSYVEELRDELEEAGVHVSEESINQKIMEAMKKYEPEIEDLLARYGSMYQQLGLLQQSVVDYTDRYLEEAKQEILDYLYAIEESWSLFPGDGTATEDQIILTEDEIALQAMILAELRKNILYFREVEGTYTTSFDYFIVTDENRFDDACDIKVAPKVLTVTSNMSSVVGYSYVTVSPALTDGHKYLWKATDVLPIYYDDLTTKGYVTWDGSSEIEVENGVNLVIVEADLSDRAIKCGSVISESRLEHPKELEILDVLSVEGSTVGYTELNINPVKEAGNIYMIKPATTIPEYDTILSSEYKEWDGVSEIKMDVYDMTTVCLVECTSDFHRARKVGLFYIDLANELIGRLRLKSEAGTDLYYTKITSITPLLTETGYRIKNTKDTILPRLNEYVHTDEWRDWDPSEEILCELGDNLIIAEVDFNTKVKRAGLITPVINNTLPVLLTYDSALDNINHIFITDPIAGASIYYYAYDPNIDIGVTPVKYGTVIDKTKFSLITDDGFAVTDSVNKVSIVEELNGIAYRSCVMDAILDKAGELTVTSVAGTSIGHTAITVSPAITEGNVYYIKALVMEDGAEYAKNEAIDPTEFETWDGVSEVDLTAYIGTDPLYLRVLECTTTYRVVSCGTVIPVFTTE